MGVRDSTAAQWLSRLRPLTEPVLVVLTVGALAAGGIAWLAGRRDISDGCWIAGTVLAVLPALVWVVLALRHGALEPRRPLSIPTRISPPRHVLGEH